MRRQVLTLLLIPALLANQTAMCCAHVHDDSGSNEHSTKVHLHLSTHSHAQHSQVHDYDALGEIHVCVGEPRASDSNGHLSICADCPSDHDSGAVFFAERETIRNDSGPTTLQVISSAASFCEVAVTPQIVKSGCRGQFQQVAPFVPYSCAIYLQVRALLI